MSNAEIELDEVAIRSGSQLHTKPIDLVYSYGTAGFRTTATLLDSVLFRVGILAALRSKKHSGKVIGVMVTASHNPEQDNGVKLADPHGEILETIWERYATLLANAVSDDALIANIKHIIAECSIDMSYTATVVFGHDTRPSCPDLVRSLQDGLATLQTKPINAGLVTTPQLHYLVRCLNTHGTTESYGEPTVEGYYQKLAQAFTTLSKGHKISSPLTVDCANGVGAPQLKDFARIVGSDVLPLAITKDDITTLGALNSQCGADYVKTQQRAPPGVTLITNRRYCSFDGDADRIIFYYSDDEGVFHLLDGDKIAGLVASFIIELVQEAGLALDVGTVQTAYANGASTDYLTNVLQVPVKCVSTGVKHLHHAAETFEVGVYFEANGHGTVVFSPSAINKIKLHAASTPGQQIALDSLVSLIDLINQTVGDAISDMLLVEIILLHRSWGPSEWDKAYIDLPNRLVKVIVQDRTLFSTSDAERRLETPVGLQETIDKLVAKYSSGRSFVRPSGTEDCVRVYAEGATRRAADELAQQVAGLVFDLAGKGSRPDKFA